MTSFNLAFSRNKLAFLKHKWYVLLNINEVLSFDVKAFGQLGAVFRPIAAGSAVMALAISPSFADDAPRVQNVASSVSSVQFYEDANPEAAAWVADKSQNVAVVIRYGGLTSYPAEFIENTVRDDLERNGIQNAVFFWERGDAEDGTAISVETDKGIFGPHPLGQIRKEIPSIAQQIGFNRTKDYADASPIMGRR